MNYQEFTGKTVDEAIENGLKELNVSRENVEIRVLEEGKKKLFGSVKARVEIAVKEVVTQEKEREKTEEKPCCKQSACEEKCETNEKTDGERAVEFLEGLFEVLGISATSTLVSENEKIEINVAAANTNEIIGKRGATIDAIQTLASAVANKGRDKYARVVVDCENYRETREATLKRLAENLAQKAIRFEKKIRLEPMNPYERRIIHSALSEYEGVKTQSEGKEPQRYIVIIPDNVKDPSLPASPVREERRGGNRGGRGYDRNRGGNRGGNRTSYNKKPYNRGNGNGGKTSGGTTLKNNDFFGTFLGNSNKNN